MKAVATGCRGGGLAGDKTAPGPRMKPAVMERCQIGDHRHEGNRGALVLKQTQEDMLHERVYGDDQMRAVGLQDLA